MSTFRSTVLAAPLLMVLGSAGAAGGPNLGQPALPEDVAAWDISILPDGRGLPHGSGTPQQGERVYIQHCASCHGLKGAGKPNDQLVGGQGSLAGGQAPVKTVGSYWPYATTIFDYVRRSMPLTAPQTLSNDEVYAVTAYLLNLNGIIGEHDAIDAESLPRVKMPNQNSFKSFYLEKPR
jgi:S-disulfanyl-L-cysteine oxidoreductase SoxD